MIKLNNLLKQVLTRLLLLMVKVKQVNTACDTEPNFKLSFKVNRYINEFVWML